MKEQKKENISRRSFVSESITIAAGLSILPAHLKGVENQHMCDDDKSDTDNSSGELMLVNKGHVEFGFITWLGMIRNAEFRGPMVRPLPQDRTMYLDAIKELGIKTIREDFVSWADVEPVRGDKYNFEPFDDIARKASERGIEIIAIFCSFPSWATGRVDNHKHPYLIDMRALPQRKYEKDFRRFISAMVKRYCGLFPESIKLDKPIRNWLFQNELDHLVPAYYVEPDEYAYWLRIFWEEVKKADPGSKVINMGMAAVSQMDGISDKWLNSVLDSENLRGDEYPYFDVAAFHAYPGNFGHVNSYSTNAGYGKICRLLYSKKLNKEVWITETGNRNPDQRQQAIEIVKNMVHGASTGVSRVYLLGNWDLDDESLWGIFKGPSGKKPVRKKSYDAVKLVIDKIGDNLGITFLGPGRYMVFLPNARTLYVLWKEPGFTDFDNILSKIKVTTIWNNENIVEGSKLNITSEPIFVEVLN